jgi:Transglutaminase-like superfamily
MNPAPATCRHAHCGLRPFIAGGGLALALLACCLPNGAAGESGDALESEQWYVGDLNGQPAMTIHAALSRHKDGLRRENVDTKVVINRSLAGTSIRFEVEDLQRIEEDAAGLVESFQLDHRENDQAVSASGRVVGTEVVATMHHLGLADEVRLPIPPGATLIGQQAGQDLLTKRSWKPGDQEHFAGLALVSNQLRIIQTTATFNHALANGDEVFDVVMDLVPVPTTMTITPKGDLVGMTMALGFIAIEVHQSKGPVPLEGAELAPTGLVTAAGPAPSAGPRNRYRLPPGASIALDEFQSQQGAEATVTSQAAPSALADAKVFLRAEPQLEIDDPAMRAWVEGIAAKHRSSVPELAENLRLAVRAYIVVKDLSMGDATALEAFRERRGDCTEHANLLCAALRIAGIPARVECGLVYADTFGGWVGHAWNSAYVDGRWIHLDSAYPGVERSCYLKLGSTSGGPWQNTGAAMLGNLAKVMGKTIETLAP